MTVRWPDEGSDSELIARIQASWPQSSERQVTIAPASRSRLGVMRFPRHCLTGRPLAFGQFSDDRRDSRPRRGGQSLTRVCFIPVTVRKRQFGSPRDIEDVLRGCRDGLMAPTTWLSGWL